MLMFRLHPGWCQAMGAIVDATRRVHGLTGQPIEPGGLHVSLTGFGDCREIEEVIVRAVVAAAANVRMPPFDLVFDRIVSFRNGGPLVLLCGAGVNLVIDLERRINGVLNDAGLRLRRRASFVPHCTMLYDKRLVPEMPLDRPITVRVAEFHLLRSKFGDRQSVGRWPLLG